MVILGISQISQVAREGWLAKVHSEQFHLRSASELEFLIRVSVNEGWLSSAGRVREHSEQCHTKY